MRIHLIAVGNRMPSWVVEGYQEYARRLRGECELRLVEVTAGKRGKNADIQRILEEESKQILEAVPRGAAIWALDVKGRSWDTPKLARQLDHWMHDGRDLALLVGGPEGLAPGCINEAEGTWSLSPLTFPHPLVRVVLAEQLYRAWSLLRNHPYHRE